MIKNSILRKFSAILAMTAVLAVVLPLKACAKEPEPTGIITMTTKASEMRISLAGAKDIAIDWGDGKTGNLNDAILETLPGWFVLTHEYSGTTARNIVITGNVTGLNCYDTQLTALDVSKNTALTELNCGLNQLNSLDLSKNTELQRLECDSNQINSLDVSKNPVLWLLSCVGNQLTTSALNDLFRTLPLYPGLESGKFGDIFISYRGAQEVGNPGNLDCDRSIAEKKGWIFRTKR